MFSPALSATFPLYGQAFRLDHRSRFELFRTILAYRLGDELDRITTPLLIAATEDEPATPATREHRVFHWLAQQFDLAATRACLRATGSGGR